jgi:hypothetical protein
MGEEQKYQNGDPIPTPRRNRFDFYSQQQKRQPKLLRPGGHFWRLKHWLSERLTKKQLIIGGIVFVAILGGAVAFAMNYQTASPKPPAPPKLAVMKPAPIPIYSPLTGMSVSATDAKRPVTAVMIENSDFARPQSGLDQAGVVFEAIAEGGITRFMALYQEAQPGNLGPIRSVRPYFLQWALGFDAAVAHVGGSPDALSDIQSWNVKNLDEFYNGSYYHRISSREAPHNMYSSMADLNQLEASKGWTTSTFTGFRRKSDSKSKSPNATSVDFNISSSDFFDHYDYDAANNAYLRSEGGAKHVDAETGKQLEPKVVVAMVVPLSQGALDATGAYYSDYAVIGSGQAYIFQDGTVTTGTWSKSGSTSQIVFTDANNNPIKLNAGQTWVTAVANNGEVNYK